MQRILIIAVVAVLSFSRFSYSLPLGELSGRGVWQSTFVPPDVTRSTLQASIELARVYYLSHQKSEGNFIYQQEILTGEMTGKDNQVRQAGALWGLSSLNRDFPDETTANAVFKGIDFFAQHLKALPNGTQCFTYPGDSAIKTGTVALYCLSIIEFIRAREATMSEALMNDFRRLLSLHLDFLKAMELENGQWAKEYDITTGTRSELSSPYYDGEILLAYCKAARYAGHKELLPRINQAIPVLVNRYVSPCYEFKSEQDKTKGFFQWGCMSFNEYFEAGWAPHHQLVADAALTLAWWCIFKNDVVKRQGNTGYAVEGLVSAWNIAQKTGRHDDAEFLRGTIMKIIGVLMSWQYRGPYAAYNQELSSLSGLTEDTIGGIVGSATSTEIRIDVVQHQVHAMLLMLKYLPLKE